MEVFRNTFKIIFLGVFVLSFIFTFNSLKLSRYFPIKTVRVYGANRVDQNEIKNIITPLVNRGFFTVQVDFIKDRLLQLPWVFTVMVKRNWPDQIEIRLVEKKALAYWNNESLLSDVGELFTPRRISFPNNLPQFIGENGKQIVMLKHYQEMHRLLRPLHVNISYLELTPYLTWKIKLNNGITLRVGHKEILTRLTRFVKVYDKIVRGRAEDVDYIDLRYSNGIAVRFREKTMA